MIDRTLVNLYGCCKCGYQWISWDGNNKKEGPIPTYCPKCKNPRWNQSYGETEQELMKKLQPEHLIRETINPYTGRDKMCEYDFIAQSFFFDIRPRPEMFELRQLADIPTKNIEKRHEFMMSVIEDRIRNAAKYEKEHYSKYGKSDWGSRARTGGDCVLFPRRRRVMKGCKHKPVPEIEEALYHVTREKEYGRSGYDMWDNPTN